MNVKAFSFNKEILDALETSLSPERLATYSQAAQGDKEKAIRLYTWNTAISAAFYGPLQGLEIAIRNAIHRELTVVYGDTWYDKSACGLNVGAGKLIRNAKDQLRRNKYIVDSPHVIAELSFGFWVALLGSGGNQAQLGQAKPNYEMTLWRPALRKAFPNAKRINRKQAHEPLDHLRWFRNRIAHHEPIFDRHLQKDYDSLLEVTRWVCEETADWIEHHSRVPTLLQVPQNSDDIMF